MIMIIKNFKIVNINKKAKRVCDGVVLEIYLDHKFQ